MRLPTPRPAALLRLRHRTQLLTRATALTYGAALLIAAAVLAIGMTVWHMRSDALQSAVSNADTLAIVLAEETSRSLQAVDIVLRDTQDLIAGLGVATPDDFKRFLGTQSIYDYLRSRADRLPQVDTLTLVAADGLRVNYSVRWPDQPNDLSDREYMAHFNAQNDPALFISRPVVSRATHAWTIIAARRVTGPDGRFLGVVLASMPLQVFSSLYASIDLPQAVTFSLLRRDGTILVRHPDPISHIGTRMPAASAWFGLVAAGGGHYQSPGYFDDEQRLVAVRPLRDYEMVVDVGIPTALALAHWRRMATVIAIGTAPGAGFLLILLLLLRRQLGRLELSRATVRRQNDELTRVAGALRDSEARLDAKSHALDITLTAMDQGLMMVDAQGVVAVCNARALTLLDLPPALTAGQPAFAELAALHPDDSVFTLIGEALAPAAAPATGESPLPLTPQCGEYHFTSGSIVEARCVRLRDGGVVATFDDITARRHAERQIAFMARHDPLTRLPNRAALVERLEQAIVQAGRGVGAAVLCLDLDRFKQINDTLGHSVGDHLLCAVAERLNACIRQVDAVARLGGDEFAVVQADAPRAEDAGLLARRIIEVLTLPYELGGHQVAVGASVGIALIPADGADPDTLLKNADIAMYRAKSEGRGIYRFFAPEMDARLQERRKLELDLQHALTHHEFELYYQPLIDLATERICSFEALLRWNHPVRGMLEPEAFLPLTEEMGMIVPLGDWAVREACQEATAWPDGVAVAVNLSPMQFHHRDLVPMVNTILRDTGLPARRLELEITEAVLLPRNEAVLDTLRRLRSLGVRVAIDRFGGDASSLASLRSFPFDRVKIDRTFVRDLPGRRDAGAIVRAMVQLGTSLGIATTAVGVETGEQLGNLRVDGCTEIQGNLICWAAPASEVPTLLQSLGRPAVTAAA